MADMLFYPELSHSNYSETMMMTPINSTYAVTFGLPSRNVSVVCIREGIMQFRGVWVGDNPFKFVTPVFLLQLSMASILTGTCNFLLKPFGQVSFVSQMLGGFMAGPSVLGRNLTFKYSMFPFKSLYVLETISSFGCMFFLFLVGVGIDLRMIRTSGRKAWAIGISTFLLPMMLTVPLSFILRFFVKMDHGLKSSITFLAVLQSTSTFHGVAWFLKDLKLLNSELGRLAIASSMISGLLSYLTLLIAFSAKQTQLSGYGFTTWLHNFASAVGQVIFMKYFIKRLMIWMNKQIPRGEPVKELHHCVVLALVLASAFISEVLGQHYYFGPMALGLAVPAGSPLAYTLMDKLDCFVSAIILPLYFITVGGKTNLGCVTSRTFFLVELVQILSVFSKFIAALVSCILCDINLKDGVVLGLMSCTIGILEVQFYVRANQLMYIDFESYTILVISAMCVTGAISPLVKVLYDPSMRYVAYMRQTIQHTKRDVELRVIACVHFQENVPVILNILEASNPTRESPICIYLLHLVELVGRASSLLVNHRSFKKMKKVESPAVASESIINAFRTFERNNQSIVTLQPFTAIAPYATMHDDICALAMDKKASLVIIPFHRRWNIDGLVESAKYRNVNLQVVEKAPCSVAILVDRGAYGGPRSVLGSWSFYRVAVVFLGGPDDRESVAYAMRMAGHPNVSVTVIRIVAFGDKNEDAMERKFDGDVINEFRMSCMGSERILYKEEIVSDVFGTVTVVRSLENSYDLIMVGRRHERESPLLSGLTEWNQYPELGYIGDMLASEDFKGKVSVLVIQQHACIPEESPEGSCRFRKAVLRHQNSFAPSEDLKSSNRFRRRT